MTHHCLGRDAEHCARIKPNVRYIGTLWDWGMKEMRSCFMLSVLCCVAVFCVLAIAIGEPEKSTYELDMEILKYQNM